MPALDAAALAAESKLGAPYVWGAAGPYSFDCSGLVFWAYKTAGIPITRQTAAGYGRMGKAVDAAHAVTGDLVYIDEPGATDHVGLYLGNGTFINAPHSGASVEIDPVPRNAVIRDITADGSGTDSFGAGLSTTASQVAAGAAAAASALNPFSGWQSDVLSIALKVAGAAACAALVIVGAKETVKGTS